MNPNLRRLFDAVADLPPEQQRAALAALTADADLIDEVLRMCGHVLEGDGEISAAIAAGASNLEAALSQEIAVGDELGAWRLTEKIGQGGMGSVFLAERIDGHFQQAAAVKVMYGLPTLGATVRLAQERQILAGLTHPNIARLFDGGATPNGQPYLVLEYIKGLPVDAFCQSNQLGFVQILALMLPICDAIAFAHQRLIIHCDIKPSNILVNHAGAPSLLDFGIANLVGEGDLLGSVRSSDHAKNSDATNNANINATATHFTQTTMRGTVAVAYTPRYASPEQKEGKLITTASDIYSLGRVLEELCARDPAFAGDQATRRGSINTHSKAGLQYEELRAILDKACAEIPATRYGSVQGLAADIKNLLQGTKVEAAAGAPSYSRRKWVNQHWLKTTAAAVFLAVILGSSLRVAAEKNRAELQATNAEFERGKAETERLKAESERKKAEAARISAESERAIAEGARATAEAQRQTASAARVVAETAQRETQIAKNDAVKQRDVAEDARKKALSAEQLAVLERDRVVKAKKSTEIVNNFLVSIFDGANPSAGGNRNASALDVVANAEKRFSELKDVDPEAQAQLYEALSRLHRAFSNVALAAKHYKNAADAYAKAGEAFHTERVLALVKAAVASGRDDYANAVAYANEAVALAAPRKSTDPLTYVRVLNAKMGTETDARRYDEADKIAAEIDAVYRLAFADPWTHPAYRSFRYNAATTKTYTGRYVEAEIDYKAVINFDVKTVPIPERNVLDAYIGLANALLNLGKNEDAEAAYTQAIQRATRVFGADDKSLVILHRNFGAFLRSLGRYDEAEQQFSRLETLVVTQKLGDRPMADLLLSRYQLAEQRGDYAQVIGHAERAAVLYAKASGEFNVNTAYAYFAMARAYAALKQLPMARQYAERGRQMTPRIINAAGALSLFEQRTFALVELAEGKPLAAINIMERAMLADSKETILIRYLNKRDAALAWQAAASAATTVAEAEAARAKSITYAREGQAFIEKTSGRSSPNYKTISTLLESLGVKG